jgi:hypothetical protein
MNLLIAMPGARTSRDSLARKTRAQKSVRENA